MKKSLTFCGIIAACVAIAVLLIVFQKYGTSYRPTVSYQLDPQTQDAKSAVLRFIDAEKSGDVDQIINMTIDMRYGNNISEQRTEYEKIVRQDPVTDMNLFQIKKIGDTLVMVSLNATLRDGTRELVTLPVYKMDGSWKIVMGGVYSGARK